MTNHHVMTTDAAGTPTFTCTAPPSSDCHIYPHCDCEDWSYDHDRGTLGEHAPVQNPECWLSFWFTNAEAIAELYHLWPEDEELPANRSGAIDYEWNDSPVWSFVGEENALNRP